MASAAKPGKIILDEKLADAVLFFRHWRPGIKDATQDAFRVAIEDISAIVVADPRAQHRAEKYLPAKLKKGACLP